MIYWYRKTKSWKQIGWQREYQVQNLPYFREFSWRENVNSGTLHKKRKTFWFKFSPLERSLSTTTDFLFLFSVDSAFFVAYLFSRVRELKQLQLPLFRVLLPIRFVWMRDPSKATSAAFATSQDLFLVIFVQIWSPRKDYVSCLFSSQRSFPHANPICNLYL